MLSPYNRFYSAGALERLGGKLIFCAENQAVVLWGFDEGQGWRADPPVYQGVNDDEVTWYPEANRCSDFLAGMIYWQALHGGLPHIAFNHRLTESIYAAAADAWPLVWQDDDTQVYSHESLVFAITRSPDGPHAQAASTSNAAIQKLWKSLA